MAQVKDPVCGMMIDENRAVGTSEYNGKHYSFCSQDCKTTFDQNPEKYAGKT
jgi:YHS domain-containing protein